MSVKCLTYEFVSRVLFTYITHLASLFCSQAVHLMDREARAEAASGSVHVRYRVDCLLKAISACHKCDLDAAQVRKPLDVAVAVAPRRGLLLFIGLVDVSTG